MNSANILQMVDKEHKIYSWLKLIIHKWTAYGCLICVESMKWGFIFSL